MKHASHVMDARHSPDGSQLVTTGYDGSARLWDSRNGHPVSPWLWCGNTSCFASFGPDGRRLLIASSSELRLWEMPAESPTAPRFPHANALTAQFTPDGKRVLTAGGNDIRMRDVEGGAEVFTLKLAGPLVDARLSADGRTIAAIGKDHALHFWDAGSGREIEPARALSIAGSLLGISPDGRRVLVMDAEGDSQLLNRDASAQAVELPPLGARGRSVFFSPDGRFAAGTGDETAAWIFDTRTNAATLRVPKTWNRGAYVSFSADSRRAILRASDGGSVRIVDPATGLATSGEIAHRGLFPATFSADGTRLVLGTDEGTVFLGEATTGAPEASFIRPVRPPFSARLSPDGRLLATASDTSTIEVWEVATGMVVTPPFLCPRIIRDLAWSPDGNTLLLTTDRGASIISVAPAQGTAAELRREAELFSERELDANLGLRPLSREEVLERWKRR